MKYYLDDADYVWAEKDGKVYAYNYSKKQFVLSDETVDPMTWHEFPKSELEKNIKINEHLFK